MERESRRPSKSGRRGAAARARRSARASSSLAKATASASSRENFSRVPTSHWIRSSDWPVLCQNSSRLSVGRSGERSSSVMTKRLVRGVLSWWEMFCMASAR